MSWYVSLIGIPAKIVTALDEQSATLTGDSKEEFDEVLPHLKAILLLNTAPIQTPPVLKIEASGHKATTYSNCTVTIERISGVFV